jgi:hypothetical protein
MGVKKAYWVSGGITPRVLNVGSQINALAALSSVPNYRNAGWAPQTRVAPCRESNHASSVIQAVV